MAERRQGVPAPSHLGYSANSGGGPQTTRQMGGTPEQPGRMLGGARGRGEVEAHGPGTAEGRLKKRGQWFKHKRPACLQISGEEEGPSEQENWGGHSWRSPTHSSLGSLLRPRAWSSNLWGTLCPSKSSGRENEQGRRKNQTSWGRAPRDTLRRLPGTSAGPLTPKSILRLQAGILPCRAPRPSRAPPHSRALSATQAPLNRLGPSILQGPLHPSGPPPPM